MLMMNLRYFLFVFVYICKDPERQEDQGLGWPDRDKKRLFENN